ncbi:hypothetical protein CU311_07085 [Prochlorococcus marinus str. MU1402]|uniref:hypothetical protein n=1 Tax=Prochlorococcus marinus TaxID=1219 RepID=UPI001ADA13F0|nr:hypothetical protein [Prochlorococcus marinus]MBO8232444.1 hypothetical protein [Prochlorococcus marinus XMU1402]MBW3057172.1 hypothetical protein [Prochlorococcus marinus str. MU1402]
MGELYKYLLHFIVSSLFTFLILKKSIPLLYKIFPAKPTQRGMHKKIMPSSGGISFIVTYSVLAIYQGFYLPLLSLPLAFIGIIDDKFNISKLVRYIFQVVTLCAIVFYISKDQSVFISKLLDINSFFIILIIFFGTIIINSVNFMDGIDGLICGSMIVIFLTLNTNFHYLIPIIGTLSAFLFFNWYPSKVFMGDSGSLFLGAYLTSLIYKSNSIEEIIKIILLISPLLFDALVCLIRRAINKQNIFNSHKLHLYQRLVAGGLKHSHVSLLYILSISFLSIFYIFTNIYFLSLATLLIVSFGIYLDNKFARNFH